MNEEIFIAELIKQQVEEETWDWLNLKATLVSREQSATELNMTFAFIPKKTGNKVVPAVEGSSDQRLRIKEWTLDRLTRVWLLMQVDSTDKSAYLKKIENLFSGATMNEGIALYSALPVLAYPEEWEKRCAEGIRSNIGGILEAIMYDNVYPFDHLDDAAWNQMVLKAFFTEKKVDRIIGLDQRANSDLAAVLFDYAHERWAAGRSVNPQLWRLTGKFLAADNFFDIQRLFDRGSALEKKVALLACSGSEYLSAKLLLDSEPGIKKNIAEGKLHWGTL